MRSGEGSTMRNFLGSTVPIIQSGILKSMRLRWAGRAARMEEGRNVFKILTSTPTGKRLLGWLVRRWEDNIRMDL